MAADLPFSSPTTRSRVAGLAARTWLDTLTAGLSFTLSLALYMVTLLPTVGYVDAPIYVRRAAELDLGISSNHHPLYVLLGHLFLRLPLGPNPAYRLNLLTALFGALAVAVVCAIVLRLTGSRPAALLAALALTTAHTFWFSSNEAEVYSLNALLLGLVVYAFVAYHTARRPGWLLLMAFWVGVGLCNHQQMVLVVPPLAAYLLHPAGRPPGVRWLAAACAAGLLGLSFYLGLFVLQALATSWPTAVDTALGGGFRSLMLSSPGGAPGAVGIAARFPGLVLWEFGLSHALLATTGMWRGLHGTHRAFYAVLGGFLVLNTGFFVLYDVPDRVFFYTPSFVVLSIALGAALADAFRRLPSNPAPVAALAFEALPLVASVVVLVAGTRALGASLVAGGLAALSVYVLLIRRPGLAPHRAAMLILLLLAPIGAKPVFYAAAADVLESALPRPALGQAGPFVPSIPGRRDVAYYVNPSKAGVSASDGYQVALASLPPHALVVDDWYHGYSILRDYDQRVLGLRPDVEVVGWFALDIVGADVAAQERMFAFLQANFGLPLPEHSAGQGLLGIATYVRGQALAGRPVYLSTGEASIDTLAASLRASGLTVRPGGPLPGMLAVTR